MRDLHTPARQAWLRGLQRPCDPESTPWWKCAWCLLALCVAYSIVTDDYTPIDQPTIAQEARP